MALRGDSDSVVMTDSSNQDFRNEMSTGHQTQEGQLEKFEDDSSVEDECSELGEEDHCSEREDEMENSSEETDDDDAEEEDEDYSDRDVSDRLESGSIHGEGDDERGAVHDRHDAAEELDGSSMEDTGRDSQEMGDGVSQPLQLDHVDFILDSIDAELSEIINRTDVNGQTSHNKRNTNCITKNLPREHTQPLNNGNQLMTEEKALDTGLGTGSPGDSREASPKPFHQPRKTNSKRKGKRLKKPPNDWSDAESIASVDVRARVQEVLTKHEPSQHESLLALTPRSMDHSALPASPLYDSNRGDDFNENHVKYPKIPNSALRQSSDSSSKMPRSSKNGKHKKPNSKRSKPSPDFDMHAHDALRVIEQWKSEDNMSDLESIATEDFETKYQQFAPRTPSPNLQSVSTLPADGSSQNVRGSAEDLRKLVLAQSIRPRTSFVKEEKSVLPAPPRESGLPEYMYLKKEITESDVGSDSVWTEDYEAQYWKAGLNKQRGFPIGRGIIPKMAAGLDSDRESVQTEDYESHFNHLMVKQLAGVPLQYYDGVSVASDLDSFQSAEVIEKVGQLKAAGVIPNRALKKRRGGKHKQRRNFLTSTPYHPKREGQTTQEQNRTIGRQIVIDDLNSPLPYEWYVRGGIRRTSYENYAYLKDR